MKRPICANCKQKPAAVNYIRNGERHYRKFCDSCNNAIKKPGKRKQVPSWMLAGYKKKMQCENCGFKAEDARQMTVFYVDGDMRNNNWANLKSVCSNCAILIPIKGLGWVEDDIKPDF